MTKTKKGAASIYIVIFTTTLLGIIALSFVRIMLAESLRTTNYSLSQSAYNSALAGVEDAKIVLLRYQSCLNNNNYKSGGGKTGNCQQYEELFGTSNEAYKTSQDCGVVGKLLHPGQANNQETLVQTRDNYDTGTIDQAYTCVKIAAYTEDFLATLNSKNPTKLIPLRTDGDNTQKTVNRIQIQWFDDQNYNDVSDTNGVIKSQFDGFYKSGNSSDLTGKVLSNKGNYSKTTASDFGNNLGSKAVVPPALQVSIIQTSNKFTMDQFYTSEGVSATSKTNRGTLLLRPTSKTDADIVESRKINTTSASGNHSNVLPQNALAYSANKSFNTPMDVICKPGDSSWGTYACSADFYVPSPIGDGSRNMSTFFAVVSLPYGGPQTDVSVKMFNCQDPQKPINEIIGSTNNCQIAYFANVQPMIDSTGRANDLFRRVESRIELADTNFPIANYALAMTDPSNTIGIVKDFYVTKNCSYTSSTFNPSTGAIVTESKTCANARKNSTSSLSPGKGNGES